MISCLRWRKAWDKTAVFATLTNSLVQSFNIPQALLFPTFRVVVPVRTAGDITVKLRFGFDDPDTDAATEGIDFALLNSVSSDTRSPVWINAGVAPNFVGNSNSILPPRVDILITTNNPAGFNGQAQVYYTGIIVP